MSVLDKVHLFARVADSVMEDEDFGVFRVNLSGDGQRVLSVEEVRPGVYGPPEHLVGQTIEGLSKWSHFDNTGRHPENYHQLASSPDGAWRERLHPATIRQMLRRE